MIIVKSNPDNKLKIILPIILVCFLLKLNFYGSLYFVGRMLNDSKKSAVHSYRRPYGCSGKKF